MESLKVLSTKITRTSDFALLEVRKEEDFSKLIEKIANSLYFGINNKFVIKSKTGSKDFFIFMSSERVDNISFVREVLKETTVTLLFPR